MEESTLCADHIIFPIITRKLLPPNNLSRRIQSYVLNDISIKLSETLTRSRVIGQSTRPSRPRRTESGRLADQAEAATKTSQCGDRKPRPWSIVYTAERTP